MDTFVRETLLVIGFVSMFAGLWMIYPAAALIICGSALVWIGLPPRRGKGGDAN